MGEKKCYLGFDFSTQQLKAIVINEQCEITHQSSVNFDVDLPEFRTHGGVHKQEDNVTITAPTLMWVKSLDMLLERLKLEGLDFSTVVSLSGAAQQHGSVYWKTNSEQILKSISPDKFLHDQLQTCFSIRDSPVWMDSSTIEQCNNLEQLIGGPDALAQLTGSRAYERFTGNQISKLYLTKPSAYFNSERISLISSFGASLFLGTYAPIDLSDASGMNLLDIRSKVWSDKCLQICAPNLKEKLGTPIPSCSILGPISPYFVERYGFSENCQIIAFTGDNPASLAGTQRKTGDMTVSLGTSDTLFLWLADPKPSVEGHILCNPIDHNDYMALLCFKNGSLTRERVREECAEGSWQLFTDILESTPRGNFGNIGVYFDLKEILPPVVGDYRFNKNNDLVSRFSKEVEVRALIEGQFIAKRVYAEELSFKGDSFSSIIATGGASTNKSIIQVLSDVFNKPVYVLDTENSACLGSAFRAKHAMLGESFCYEKIFETSNHRTLFAVPAKDAAEVYEPMIERYKNIHQQLKKLACSKFPNKVEL